MSGRGAPARTAIATPDRTRSTRLSGTILPSPVSASMTSAASTTASNASPARTRFAASTPPTDSRWTACDGALPEVVDELGQHLPGGHRRHDPDRGAHRCAQSAPGRGPDESAIATLAVMPGSHTGPSLRPWTSSSSNTSSPSSTSAASRARRACSASHSRPSAGRCAASRWSCASRSCCATAAARRPTEAGKRLVDHARSILLQVERARREVDEVKGAPVGHVVVGLPPTLALALTVPIVREFRRRYPRATREHRRGPVGPHPRMGRHRARRRRHPVQPVAVTGGRAEAAGRRAAVPRQPAHVAPAARARVQAARPPRLPADHPEPAARDPDAGRGAARRAGRAPAGRARDRRDRRDPRARRRGTGPCGAVASRGRRRGRRAASSSRGRSCSRRSRARSRSPCRRSGRRRRCRTRPLRWSRSSCVRAIRRVGAPSS